MGNEYWLEASLSQLLESLESGSRPKGGIKGITQGVPSIGAEHLASDGGFNFENIRYIPEDFANSMKRGIIQPLDILVVKDGATTGKTSFVRKTFPFSKACVNEHVFICRAIKLICDEYLFHYLRSHEGYTQIMSTFHGGAQGGINSEFIDAVKVPIPPFCEQKRIINKLDTILPKVKNAKSRLDKIPRILKRFRQSVLASACSGKLTEDWRDENANCEEWKPVFLKNIALSRLGKMLDRSKNLGNPTPYLRNTNVRWFDFDLDDILTMKATKDELPELWIKKGDILICEGGEPGRCAIWRGADNTYIFQKALHRVRVSNSILAEYLCFNIKYASDSGKLEDYFTGTTIKHLTGVKLQKFQFFLPSLKEQTEIVQRVERLLRLADSLEAKYAKAMECVEKIEQSVLAKAFRGELAEQDPNDESAEELLKRILAEKANMENTKKKPKRLKSRSKKK